MFAQTGYLEIEDKDGSVYRHVLHVDHQILMDKIIHNDAKPKGIITPHTWIIGKLSSIMSTLCSQGSR